MVSILILSKYTGQSSGVYYFFFFLIHIRIINFYICFIYKTLIFYKRNIQMTHTYMPNKTQIDLVFPQHFQNSILNFGSQWCIKIKIRFSFCIRNPPLENIYTHYAPCSSYSLYDKNLPLLLHGGNYCPKASLLFDFPLWCSSVASSRSKLSNDNYGIWRLHSY